MSAKLDRTFPFTSSEAQKSLRKAKQYLESSQLLLENEKHDAAGLAAIHSAILGSDAILGLKVGIRSASHDHMTVVNLLDKQVDAFKAPQRRQIVGLLRMKSTIAYDSRLISYEEARVLVNQAERYLRWVENNFA